MTIVDAEKQQFDKAIEFLKQDITGLRTGRATPAIVDSVMVEAYGSRQPIKNVASISVADAKTLVVEPWDKSIMQAVEVAIRNSDVGINPVNDGRVIRLPLPDLTAQRRQELIKVLHQKLEHARISVRKIREDIRTMIDTAEKAKEISQDDKFALQEKLEKLVKEYNESIKSIGEEKEKEITTI